MSIKTILLFILIMITMSQIAVGLHPYTLDWLNMISKPLIMPIIAAYFLVSYEGHDAKLKMRILIAMFFSFAGDVLLIFQEKEGFFIYGLIGFLLAQVFYTSAFLRPQFTVQHLSLIKKTPLIIAPFALFGWFIFDRLKNDLADLKFPVLVYTLAILSMALFALNRFGRVGKRSFYLVFAGALSFVVSDLILAFNKFQGPLPLTGIWIMLSYILAQFLIAKGSACNN